MKKKLMLLVIGVLNMVAWDSNTNDDLRVALPSKSLSNFTVNTQL